MVFYAKTASAQKLKYMGYVSLLPAFGFMYIYLTNSRTTGPETFGDKIWWNDLRPLHSILYFIFAFRAIYNIPNAYIPLALDLILGFVSFTYKHLLM